ncbi:MAG TPA: hypothetical protein VID68_01495 [Solirubrobacteraceae bacterium]
MSEEAPGATDPQPCAACRGGGTVVSNLGGEPHELPCPWCEGRGVFLRDHDAQARFRAENSGGDPA